MPADDLRTWFAAELAPMLPATWVFDPTKPEPKKPTKPTLLYKLMRLEKDGALPLGAVRNHIVLELITPIEDDIKAEDTLDNDVITLCTALDRCRSISWETATKVRAEASNRLGWDINVVAITTRPLEG